MKTGSVWYNDSEPFVCDWLENLIREKLLPQGVVDRRPIQEVEPSDVRDFAQCHFFAGIGGWAYALQLARWPQDSKVWTGSCPCQPFSLAGKQDGQADARHLWPAWYRLIQQCRPQRIFGEQVASAAGFGWLDEVGSGVEALGYAFGAVVLGAHSVGAPHARHRLYFVATVPNANSGGWERQWTEEARAWDEQQFERLVQDQLQSALPTGRLRALADGVSGRMGKLRGFGNAVVPQTAAAFVQAYLACSLPAPEDRPQ